MQIIQLPKNKPLSEQVSDLLEAQIISGDFEVGDQIPTEFELSQMYKVSRTVIREATKILKEKGRLESYPGKGTFVVDKIERGIKSTLDAIYQKDPDAGFGYLLEVREIFEPQIAALAALRATPSQIEAMEEAIGLMDKSFKENESFDVVVDADHQFHNLLAEATGNPLLKTIIKPLDILMRNQQQYMTYQVKDGPLNSQKHHKMILKAIKNRKPEDAKKHMLAHIHQINVDILTSSK